jgi:capsid portal protein
MEYAPGTNYYGRPPIIAALPAIQSDLSATRYNITFFENYGMPVFVVTVTGDFQDYDEEPFIKDENGREIPNPHYDEKQTLRYQISQQVKEVIRNPHSAMCITVPSEGVDGKVEIKITPLSVDVKEGSFRMMKKDVRDEVIHAHQVDPSRLGIFDAGNLNGTNSETTKASYKYGTIAPIKTEAESMINQIAAELEVTSWKFVINDVDPIDYTPKKELADFLFQRGAMTIMDLINNFGEEFGITVEDPDDPYLNSRFLNYVPLENVFNQSEQNSYLEEKSILKALEGNLWEDKDEDDVDDKEQI